MNFDSRKITDDQLTDFYMRLFGLCDKADELDEFAGSVEVEEIKTLLQGCEQNIPQERRVAAITRAMKILGQEPVVVIEPVASTE